MTEKTHCGCKQPQNRKDSPEKCASEQVRICHGHEVAERPCTCRQEKRDNASK